MRILFIIDSLRKGGKERRLIELMKGLLSRNFTFELILFSDQIEYDHFFELNVNTHVLSRKIKKDPFVFFRINEICKKFKPDIINSWGLMPSVYSMPIAKFNKICFINSMIINAPEKLSLKARVFSSIVFPFSDIITANSYAGLRAYGIEKSKAKVIYNGYDFERSISLENRQIVRERWNIRTDFVVGMVAGFSDKKDYKTLIESAKKILDERENTSFILVGDGPNLHNSKELAGMYNKIIFTGRQSDVESIINICDLGILSTYNEGISNSIMEFMAQAKPVIATDGGGTNEIVVNGKTGYLIPKKSPLELKEKILKLIDDKNLSKEMGINGKERIIRLFNVKVMIDEFVELFRLAKNKFNQRIL